MDALSRYSEDAFLNAMLRGATFTAPASAYLSLHTAAGADETTATWAATELTGSAIGYARTAAPPASWGGASGGIITNVATISLPTAASAWGTVTHVGIWDAATGGNLLLKGALATPRVIGNGDMTAWPAGNLTIQLR